MMMVKEQINYKSAYEEALKVYEKEHSLTSQVMSISTEQIRLGRDLGSILGRIGHGFEAGDIIASEILLAEKSYKYLNEMKYDFVVGYCDELWSALRKGLWQLEDANVENDEVRGMVHYMNTIRWQMVDLKDYLRDGEGWDDKAVMSFEQLKAMLCDFEKAIEDCSTVVVDLPMLPSYVALADYFIDAFFFGLQLGIKFGQVKCLMTNRLH